MTEFLLLIVLTDAPFSFSEVLDEWLEDAIDRGIQRRDGVLGDFAEHDLVVVGAFLIDRLVGVCSHEVEAIAAELQVSAVSDHDLFLAVEIAHFAGVTVDAEWLLVVDEDVV